MIPIDKIWLYLDDVRIPNSEHWQVVRNYDEFITHIKTKVRCIRHFEV